MEMQPTATYDYEGPPSAKQTSRIQYSPCNMQRSTTTDSNFYTNLDPESTTNGQGSDGLISQNPQQVNKGELKQVKKSMRFIKACLIGMTAGLIILTLAVTIFSLVSTDVIAITTSKELEGISKLKAMIHNLTDNQKNLSTKIDIVIGNQWKIGSMDCKNGGSLIMTGGLFLTFLSHFENKK